MIQSPHISANKLGEFVFASDAKKRSILKTLKFPSTFKNGRYPEPKSAFLHFMADPKHDTSVFEQKRNQVAAKIAITDWAKSNKKNCIDALDHLAYCASNILSNQLKYIAEKGLSNEDYDRAIRNVTIHLKPEILLRDQKSGEVKGFIKLFFSKSRPIDSLEAGIIVGAIKNHLEELHERKFNASNCLVMDVFHRRKFEAPKFMQVNTNQIRMACAEIAVLWPTIIN